MKCYRFKVFIFCAILLGTSELADAACNQTLSPGANLASAIASAATGSTICLNSGSYGTVGLVNFTKNPPVIVQAVTPLGPVMTIDLWNVNGVVFDGISFNYADLRGDGATKNITIKNSDFGTHQLVIRTNGYNNNNILIDHNTFGAFNASSGYEGRLQVIGGYTTTNGVTITNNTFGPGGCSDGVQVSARGVVIGPGNIFTGIVQGSCAVHVDAIQGYGQTYTTINGNYFADNTINIGFYDGGKSEIITNNVFGPPRTALQNLQLAGIQGMTFAHNTFRNTTVAVGAKAANSASSGWVIENNLFANSDLVPGGDKPGCGSDCIMRYNLKDAQSSTTPTGSNNVSGSPTFSGGNPPTTWTGYKLTSASLGYRAGNDGQDMGSNYFIGSVSESDTVPPLAPTNLRLQ